MFLGDQGFAYSIRTDDDHIGGVVEEVERHQRFDGGAGRSVWAIFS
jgi:hypothetical protein